MDRLGISPPSCRVRAPWPGRPAALLQSRQRPGLGRPAEAAIAFQQAPARDPGFAEAAFNIASLAEHADQPERAIPLYRQVVATHPAYPQPLYNLARLLTVTEAYAEALLLWERFIALVPDDPDARHARRAAQLCWLAARRNQDLSARDPG